LAGHQTRTHGREGIERFSPAPLAASFVALPIAGANIVGAGVAEDVVEGPGTWDILARLADDDGQLALVVHLVAGEMPGGKDRIARVLKRARGLQEQDRIFGNGSLALLGVTAIVQADA